MPGGEYVEVRGLRTYYERHGSGAPALLLHGGGEPIECFAAQVPALAERFEVFLPERRAHGRTPDTDAPLTYQDMADETVAFMEVLEIGRAHVVGYSDGANIGLLLAMQRPELVDRLVSISGNFDADGVVEPMRQMLPYATPEALAPMLLEPYREAVPEWVDRYPAMLPKLVRMWQEEPRIDPADLGSIKAPTLVMAADADMIGLDHTIALWRAVPGAQLCIVPGATHLLIEEKPELVNSVIGDFLSA
jgi:pimeloyl-ACP methyl ester carboxylesterase